MIAPMLIVVTLVEDTLARVSRVFRVPLVILALAGSVHILGLVLVEDALTFVVVFWLALVEDAMLIVFIRLIVRVAVVVLRPRSRRIVYFGIV